MSILFGRGTNFIFETDDTKSVESTCHKKNHCVLMCSRHVSGVTSVSAVGLPCAYLYFLISFTVLSPFLRLCKLPSMEFGVAVFKDLCVHCTVVQRWQS